MRPSSPTDLPPLEHSTAFEELRLRFVQTGLVAVFASCFVFGIARGFAQWSGRGLTPWWANAAGALVMLVTGLWFRRDQEQRSLVAAQLVAGTALVALSIPVAYGMHSSVWWMSLVPFSMVMLGRRNEGIVWTAVTGVLVVCMSVFSQQLKVAGGAGETEGEAMFARVAFLVVLLALAYAFRKMTSEHSAEVALARRGAERSNRAKSVFLAHMSHELRTPLNGVISMLDLSRREARDEALRSRLDTANTSARLLLRLIQDVLDATHVESGSLELHEAPFSVQRAIADAVATVAERAREAGLVLEANVAADVATLRVGDGLRVSQICLNLLGNAVKFTKEGSVRITLANGTDGGVRITVADTGRGIAAKDLERIWQPFVQVGSRDGREPGTGLGLFITRELVQVMGGSIQVHSTPGKGTTFDVELPLPVAGEDPALRPEALHESQPDHVTAPPTVAAFVLRVLVVDDDPTNRLVASHLMKALGCEVVTANDGLEALAALHREAFQLVVADLEMPQLDGLGLLARMQRDGVRIPVIVASAHADGETRRRAHEAGASAYVTKPYTVGELQQAMQQVLPRESA